MNKKSRKEQVFVLLVVVVLCFTLFSSAACSGGRESTVYGYVNRCEICGSGCLTGPSLGPDSKVCRFYGGEEGCCANSIACGSFSGGGQYGDCVLGDTCTGCYVLACSGDGCISGCRLGGCVVCGGELVDAVDDITEFKKQMDPIFGE